MATPVNYTFALSSSGTPVIIPDANIGPGISKVDFNTFKQKAQALQQTTGGSFYDKLLAGGGPEAEAIKAAEKGSTLSYGQVNDQGNLISNEAINQQNQQKTNIANGTEKIVGYTADGSPITQPVNAMTQQQADAINKNTPATGKIGTVPSPTTTPPPAPVSTYTGPSIVDYVNSIGGDSSQYGRQQLAQKYGVDNYDFSAAKNTELLNKMRSSQSSNPSTPGYSTPVSSTPGSGMSETNQSELEKTVEVYQQVYNKLGLGSIKSQAEKIVQDLKELNDKQAQEVSDVNNNPWLSEQSRGKLINSVKSKYETKISNLMDYEKLLNSTYEQGQTQANAIAGRIETNMAKALELAQKKQEALDKLKESDIHAIEVGGRDVLVDFTIRKIVADLGPSKGGGGGDIPTKTSNISLKLEQSRGKDGFSDPTIYLDSYKDWTSQGGLLKDFLTNYPPERYINPANKWLPSFLMPKENSSNFFNNL